MILLSLSMLKVQAFRVSICVCVLHHTYAISGV